MPRPRRNPTPEALEHYVCVVVDPKKASASSHAVVVRWTAVIVAFVLMTFLMVQQSYAAFSGSTDNDGNEIAAASVTLTDNDGGATAMFDNITTAVPGTNIDRCIAVTYAGTMNPAAVRLWVSTAPAGALAQYLNLTIDRRTPAATPVAFANDGTSCAGFDAGNTQAAVLAATAFDTVSAARTDYTSALSTGWTPANPSTQIFRFRFTLDDDAAAEGATSDPFGFTWEVRPA